MSAPVVRLAASQAELDDALAVRHEVFVEEQGVPVAEEVDGRDPSAEHVVALDGDGRAIGTCRVLATERGVARVGRMAVLAGHRGSGVGALLLAAAEEAALAAGAQEMVLDAQLPARRFYERAGYVAEGGVFLDAGIEHVRMRRSLRAS